MKIDIKHFLGMLCIILLIALLWISIVTVVKSLM